MSKKNSQLATRDNKPDESGALQVTMSAERRLPAVVQDAVAYTLNHSLMVRAVAEAVMKESVHYGTIPGTEKPSLYQAGAQVLSVTFKLRPRFKVEKTELPATSPGCPHREYSVETELVDAAANYIGMGVGLCSTMESKYRYRGAEDFTDTGEPVPSTYWNLKSAAEKRRCLVAIMDDASSSYGIRKITVQGVGKVWHIVKFPEERTMVENQNIADCYNTVLKIAKKRAFVDAILNATGAGDVFTQDLEDLDDNLTALQSATGLDLDGTGLGQQKQPKKPEQKHAESAAATEQVSSGWKSVIVHIPKSRVHGRALGTLDTIAIAALKKGWMDKIDWPNAPDTTREDRRLRKAIVEAMAEIELLGKVKQPFREPEAKTEPKPEPSRSPATEKQAAGSGNVPPEAESEPLDGKAEADEASKAPEQENEKDTNLAAVEHFLLSHEIEEEDCVNELKTRGLLGNMADEINKLSDLPADWLGDLLAQLPQRIKEWGYIS